MKLLKSMSMPILACALFMTSCGDNPSEKDKENMEVNYSTELLDRELFFGNPEIAGGQLSPDGKYISFLKEYNGILNIWVKGFDEPFENAYPLTNSERPMAGYFWSADGKYILYAKDKDGDENMNVFAVDPAQNKGMDTVPDSRNLTPFDDVAVQIYHVSQNDPDMMLVGINNRDKAWHDLYQLTISSGDTKMLYENLDRVTGYDFDWDDNLRLLYKTDEAGNTVMLYKDGSNLKELYETSVTEGARALKWNEDNTKFYFITNKGDLDLTTLYLMDPIAEEMTLIESDPEGKVDISDVAMDRNTRKMLYTTYVDDKTRIYWKDEKRKEIYEYLEAEFPGREISFSSATKDYSKFLIGVSGDKYASESWFFDVESKDLIHQYTPRPDLKVVESNLATMKPVSYPSSDGLMIPAYLTLPVGFEAKDLPTVIVVHGGPKGPRDYWGYNAFVQFLVNRGYAVLQPNFRASGGYGKNFQNAGDLQWGKLMQDDITWGVNYLVEQGIADKDRVAIMGGSYGGYATLAGLAFTPDVYACGVDIVGPSNIFTLLESVPAYWEAGRAFLYGMVGDPETEEGKKLIKEASPLFSADKITKPLLVVQGANDPRVKKAEADQIVIALRDNGHDVSYVLADDEGHGFRKPVNNMAMFAEIEKFLSVHLGGRYQEDMPEDVAARLAEMTVDVTSVVYSEKGEPIYSEALPVSNMSFTSATEDYDINIIVGDQSIAMSTVRTITKDNDGWKISDATSGAMGEMKDEIIYDANFTPVSRMMVQAGQEIKVNYQPGMVSIDMSGKVTNIDIKGNLIEIAPGFENILGMMEISDEGIVASTIDLSSLKSKTVEITNGGFEEIDGKKYRITLITNYYDASDITSVWTDADGGLLKTESVVPAMNNAVVTNTRK